MLIAHQQNYATSAYIALKSDASECFNFFDLDDFAEVMSTLEFVEVARVLVSEGSTRDHDGTSKLLDLLETVLHPIADEDYCFFYENTDENAMSFPWLDNDSDVDSALGTVSDGPVESDDEESLISNRMEFDIAAEGNSLGFESTELDSSLQNLVPAPIFVRFLLDDKPVSAASLINIDRRSNLAVLVSVFKKESFVLTNSRKVDPAELPLSHQTAALELSALLNAYVAEQTLERLRYLGSKLQEQDFRQAKTCLRQARNIMTSTVDVFFYVAKSDAIVAASAPLVTDIEMYEGFSLLVSVLQKNEVLVLRKLAHGDVFFLEAVEEGSNALACWCVLNIRRALGVVTVEIHHHGGSQKASALMETVLEVVSMCCHRVNQLLLLRVLHGSRTASRLLIPPDLKKPASETLSAGLFIEGPFHDGLFSCPIVYRASFELFHRCAANPAQVARSLEATVMHIFAVSNRRQVFVYKDESGSVFYMRLLFRQGVTDTVLHSGTDGEAQIELLVYGIEDPGPSITQQLRKLLQKRLLLIAVDMLSSVLTKNPQYHWRQPDIIFIRSFQAHWNDIENGYAPSAFNKRRTYAFPPSAYDPGMIILFFRQNICGSTFFHPLSTMEWLPADDCGAVTRVDGTNLHFDATDLVFYYNTSSSKLDPNFQSESTLTAKGAQYARQAGSGIAIVELSLVNGKGQRLQGINAAVPTCKVSSTLNVSAESLRFHDVSGEEYPVNADHKAPAFLRVSVTDTALKSDALHQWILLSVTQVLIAWNMERLLERIQKGLIAPLSVEDPNSTYTGFQAKNWKIENICCGLPAFTGLLETAHGLPHPAALKVQYDGVVRSSAVASVALDLLEKGILDLIWSETKKKLVTDKHFRLNVVRSSRSSKPRRVQFERDSQRKVMVRSYSEKNDRASIIKDSPIDCPEYTIFFYSLDYDPEGRHINEADFPKLFEEVSVGFEKTGDKGESARSLVIFKNNHLPFFRRSFAFIFSVKRNRRTLLAYNWNAQLFNKTATRLQEMDSSFLSSTGESVASLQHRSLGRLAPAYTLKKSPAPMEQLRDSLQQKSSNLSSSSQANRNDLVVIGDRSRPPVPRPTMHSQTIRRPKLVGKSVEGSAIQAVARSRARASSSRFRGGSQPTIIATPKIHNGSLKGGRSPAIRTVTRKSSDPRRLPQGQEMLESPVEGKELRAATKEVEIAVYKQGLVRQSTLRAAAFKNLIRTRWPVRSDQTMSQSLAEYIFAVGYVAWNEVSTMLPLPEKLMDAFLISFGQTLAAWTPGLERVPTMSPNIGVSSFLLMGKTRSVRNCKCFVVVRLSTSTMIVNSDRKVIVLSEGRLLTMPRHSKRVGKGYNSQTIMEHSSTGLDKLSSELHAVLGLQGKLLDHASSIIERTMKSAAGSREYDEVFRVLKRLVETFSLRSLITVRSNYKVLQKTTC